MNLMNTKAHVFQLEKSSYCKVTVFDFYKAEVPMKNNPDNAMGEWNVSGKDSETPFG